MGSFVKKNNDDETKKSTSGSFVRIGESKNRKGFSTAPKVDVPATTPISVSQSRLSASESLWDRGSAFSGIDIDAKLTELAELRRQAAVDLDTTRVDELDKRMKSLRAQAGQQTVGDRVSDTLSAIVSGTAAQGTNVVGFASNAVNNPEYHQRSIARLEETLKSGRTTDGKVLTDAMRETIKSSIADHKKRVEELEKKDSFTNRTYKAADQMANDSAKYQSKAKQGLGAVGSTLVDAGVAFGQSALAGTVGAVTGTGMLPFAVTAFGGATQDARRNGATLDEQFTYGTAQAAKEFVTEKLFGLAVPQKIAGSVGSFDGLIEKGIRNVTERLAKTPGGQQALGGLMTWLAGGVTEGLEEGIGALVEETIINPHLRGFVEDERTTQEKFEEGLYNVLVGGVSGLLGVTNLLSYNPSAPTATATTAPKAETKAARANPAAETATSPAAAPEVKQAEAQAQVTKAKNPGAEVLDAATTLFTQQGMNLKTAQKRAEIVGKLVAGEEVSDKDLNRIEPTSKQTKAIFTQLTGVQFPAEATSIEKLRDLYRSAHTVAQAAEAQQRAAVAENARVESQITDEQILERAKEARAKTTPESDKKAAQMLAQARGEIAPDGTALLSYKDFSARHKQVFPDASPQETARMYDLYLKDNQTISFMGRRMTRQQVLNTLNTAPGVERLTAEERAQVEADLNEKFDRELEAQKKDGKDATEHSERRRRTEVREKVQRSVNDWKNVLIKNSSVKDIVLDESLEENEAAFITPDGVIHLNAKRMTSEADVAYVLGHELVHSIDDSTARKAMVNDIIDTVRKITEPTESREDAIERYRKMYQEHENQVAARANREAKTISFEYAEEEYAADLMREVFLSGDMLNKLAAEKPSLMARIQEILQKWIASLKGNNEAVELYNELTALQDRFVKALQTDAAQQKLALENAGIQVDTETESARHDRYSLDTWLESDYMTDPENAAKALAKAIGVSDEKAAKYIKDVNGVAKLIADDKTLLDYEAAPGMSSFVSNTEYGGSVDFSTICKKRRLFTGTFTAIQKALPNTALTSDEMIDIRKRMKDAGHEVSCGLCYVEGSRLNLGQYATEFLDKYTAEDHEFVPAIADLTTVEGQENLRLEHPDVYEAYIKYLNSLAQRKPKVYQTATAYDGEILKKFGGDKDTKVEEKNKNGGLRLQSFSDFEIIHLIDNMQVIMDMARVGLAGQAYTKVPDFAWAMGNTGLKINLSLIAKDVDADGHLVFDDVEGMPHDEAKKLRDAYSDNVGTIIVVFNDAQLKAAMADDFIDYIIPFHRSQLNQKQYDGLGLPKGAKDYTMVQNESYIEPVLNKNGKKTRPENYMPNKYWDFNKPGKENAEDYLKMCAENNRRPKFSNVLEYNGDGSYSLPADGSADGYWKLLIDFKMYNNDGVGVPQQPVKPDFNIDEANRMLSEYKGGHSNFPVAQDIVDEFVADYKKNHPDVRYSVDPDFSKQLRAWDGKTTGFSFVLGQTSEALRRAGLPKKQIRWDASKIATLMKKHSGMSLDVIEQVPEMLENPIIVIDSKKNDGVLESKIVMGDLYDDNGKIVTVVLLLTPTSRKGNTLDLIKVSSAEGRGHIQSLFTYEDGTPVPVRFVDEKRIQSWLNANRLQLPLRNLNSDSNSSVTRQADSVNTKYSIVDSDYMAAVERGDMDTAQKMVDEAAKAAGYKDVVCHGTSAEFTKFNRGELGIHVGTLGQATDRDSTRVMKLYAKLGKTFEIYRDYGDWHGKNAAEMMVETEEWEGLAEYDETKFNEIEARLREIAEMPDNAHTDTVLREYLQSLGWDSITYENRFEDADESWTDENWSHIVFDPEDVKSADPVTYDDNGNVIPLSERFQTNNPDIRYSITPQFEQWYKETYGEDLTSSQLKRRLQTAERRAAEAEHDKKAAELKNTIDSEMDLTAWMIHHTKKMREQKRASDAKLADARKAKTEAVRAAVAETKEIERAKAEVQRDADRMAERRNAAKRLRTQENAYTNKVTEMKENAKLKRNAAKATLRDSRLAAKKRAEIETEQGLVDTIRKNPKQRTGVEKLQDAAQQLRTLGRSAYRNFVNMAESIDRFSKRQVSDMRAGTLVNILGGSASTMEAVFKKGLVDRAGNRIGESMSDVFLCWDEAHKKVNEGQQALLQDFMLHWHNIDRMSIVARAESALETFELNNEWLRDMDQKEFARLVAMTEKEVEKLGKYEAQQRAFEYVRLIRAYNEAQNKPIFADDKGNSVTGETSQRIVDQYLAEQPWLLDKANGIYEWWDLFMRNWAVGDTISEAEYNRMRQMYPHYVPTYRADKNGVGGAGFVGAGGATVSKAVKKAKGSHSEVMNIEDSFSNIVSKIIRLNRLNELYMNIIDTAMLDEDGTFADMAYFDWDWQDGAYANALITGSADIADLTDTVEETEKAGLEKVGSDYKLTGWLNGRKYTAYISEDLYKSIGMVTGHLANDLEQNLLKAGNTLTTPMKTAITGINPTFAIRNLSRDLPTAIINSISGLNFPKYYAQAAKEIAKNSDHWKTFQALGGTHATYYNDNQGFTKAMSRGQNPAAWAVGKMGAFNEITEAQTRFAEYLATVDKLGDTYEARLQGIKNAAEVTVDFSRKGRYGKVINAWVPYWNPAVQGIDKTVRSVIDSPDGSAVWKQASKTLGRAAMTTVLFEAILYGVLKALDRDDEWEELNDRTKDTYYCIPLKDSNRFLKIPKNREWGAILGTPFMRMLEWANGREDPFENYIETAIEPNFLPPAIFRPDSGGGFASDIVGISQALDLAKNEDFAGRTIVPYAYQQGTLSQQFDNETSALAKKLGELFDWSPMQIDYIIGDYFGDFGDMFINATSEATWSGEQNIGETALEIVTNPFFADARYSNASVSKYYDLMDELGRVVQDKKNQMGNDAAKETIEYQTEKAIDEMYGKQISELNRVVRELPDGTEKDNAKSQIAQLTKEAIEFYNDSMAGKVSNPILTATYNGYSESVAKELTRMDNYSEQYSFKPRTTAPTSYVDPKNKKNEYRLDDEQKEYFMNVYAEKYDEIFEQLIQSSKYRKADNEKKAEMLEDAKADVNDAAKEEFFDWLEDNRVRSTPKK